MPISRLALQFAILAVLHISALHAQIQIAPNQPDIPSTTTHFKAVVLNSVDGKPVARVLVTSPDRRMAAITDSEGRFAFDFHRPVPNPGGAQVSANPAASFSIPVQFNVRRPGYIEAMVTLSLPTLQPDNSEPTLRLKIVPAATLTGHIYPESGDLPPHALVELRQKQVSEGSANWMQRHDAQVNSRGEFRFGNLQPGDYKLLAPAHVAGPNLPGTPPDSVPGFQTAFYPNASSSDAATPIHLNPGETSTANLAYRPATFYKVTIPVAGLAATAGCYVNLLSDMPGLSLNWDGQAAQGYLPGGDYELQLVSMENPTPAKPTPLQSSAFVHIEVSGHPVQTQPVALHPDMELPIVVRREFTSPQPNLDTQNFPALWINFQSVDSNNNNVPRMASETPGRHDSALKIENLTPGVFRVIVSPRGGYVAAVTSGTTNLLRDPLHVLAGDVPRPIEVTLRDDFASLTARILDTSVPPQNASRQIVFFLAIPLDRLQAEPLVGAFDPSLGITLSQLTPGRYLLLASHRQLFQTVEYHNETILRDLLTKGVVITLSPNQKSEVQVPLMPDSDSDSNSNSKAAN